jgi:hypothetical protein
VYMFWKYTTPSSPTQILHMALASTHTLPELLLPMICWLPCHIPQMYRRNYHPYNMTYGRCPAINMCLNLNLLSFFILFLFLAYFYFCWVLYLAWAWNFCCCRWWWWCCCCCWRGCSRFKGKP